MCQMPILLYGHAEEALWHVFLVRIFGLASAALALFFGGAIGNAVRGVSLDRNEMLSLCALALHGSLWIIQFSGKVA